MFYELKKDGVLVERFNAKTSYSGKDEKAKAKADAEAIARAKELGAGQVSTSDGRKVL